MENTSRKDLIGKKMGFNQIRNSIYWLQRLMRKHNLDDNQIARHLIKMGRNIGHSMNLVYEKLPERASSLIETLYKDILLSPVQVSVNNEKRQIIVRDSKCPTCKYQYDDIKVPGCNLQVGMIWEILSARGFKIKDAFVSESVTLGDQACIHVYQFE